MEMRGTITRRTDSALNGLEREFQSLYCERDFKFQLAALKRAWNQSDRASKLSKLYGMFDACGIPYERNRDCAYYEEVVRGAAIPTPSDIEDRMLHALYTRYRDYPTPEEYMREIVDDLSRPEDRWEGDTLRLRILKQFVKYGNCLTYERTAAGQSGRAQRRTVYLYGGADYIREYVEARLGRGAAGAPELLDALDDGVFAVLDGAKKEERRPSGRYGILKMVNDLATGQFRMGKATKRSLYLFAMVYGMTYDRPDAKTDIEGRLFRDYYANNLMRFITDSYRERKMCEYDLDPSGQGINYKNFAEMVYLYCIAGDCSPAEKLRRANEMIAAIRKRGGSGPKPGGNPARETATYRAFSEDILSLPEEEFVDFICAEYDCSLAAVRIDDMTLQAEQRTAYRVYGEIVEKLIDVVREQRGARPGGKRTRTPPEERAKWLSQCNYGLWFSDMRMYSRERPDDFRGLVGEAICRSAPGERIDAQNLNRFVDLLLAIDRFLSYASESCVDALCVASERKVTRTSLIVAYYYYYNARHEGPYEEDDRRKSFKELYDEFERGINPYLLRAYYQPLCGKNIFDVAVVFSAYAYLNL